MRRVLILAACAPLLMAQSLGPGARTEEGIPRQSCGFGEGLGLLRAVEREAAQRVPGVGEGRARGERAVSGLNSAAATFRACGCARLAQLTAEAASAAVAAPAEASVARLTSVFAQVKFRARIAREFSEERACR
ncbi:hypothetical protein EJV46_10880 [Roseococcus sp. SYP-B2431]|uniref:hypothetical protein n=1 Tax=Roseococcus sp. SYP-B2431 TaxID=2496640 RepID=UPI0010400A28|nr:hypothetical protein [Roseococcus sp. SYP-B2431]TCH99040.1 hypothetical protein EJV46_10880 [Roseococcus sp. SYP-B2431]